jgi:hypothetical protein
VGRRYQGGYRANIVAYTIAKFAHLIQFEGTGDAFDFKACWTRQSLSPAIESQLTSIAYEVFEVIVSPDGGLQNVTEWAKNEVCWSRVQGLHIPLQKELAKELVGREDDRAVKRTAEAQQTIITGIQVQMTVVNVGPEYWKQLQTWANVRSLLSPEEESFVALASGMPRKLPSEKQSARLLQIRAKVELEGFSPN